MEAHSKRNRIHCSGRSAEILKEQWPELDMRCRGKIAIKGKGDMVTWWVSRRVGPKHGGDASHSNDNTEGSLHGDQPLHGQQPNTATQSRVWWPAQPESALSK